MPHKNQITNDNQDQQRIVEDQVSESQNTENQTGGALVDGALEIASTEAPETIASSSLSTDKGTGDVNVQTTNIQSPQKDGDLPAHRGATGPRTVVGKKRSSRNAVKFGILSKATLIKGECQSDYQLLLEGIWKYWMPVGKVEELQVEKLASISWRYRRCLVAEGAEIRKASEFLEFDYQRNESVEAEEINLRLQPGATFDLLDLDGLIWKLHNSNVFKRCITLLAVLRHRIMFDGFDEQRDGSLLKKIYGDPDKPHFRWTLQDEYSRWVNTTKATEEERQSKGYETPEQLKRSGIRAISSEIARLKQDQKKRESVKSERRKVEILRQSVPDSRGMDRLLRYRSSLERDFDRTMTQLERLQRIRKGQPVSPPLKVDFTL